MNQGFEMNLEPPPHEGPPMPMPLPMQVMVEEIDHCIICCTAEFLYNHEGYLSRRLDARLEWVQPVPDHDDMETVDSWGDQFPLPHYIEEEEDIFLDEQVVLSDESDNPSEYENPYENQTEGQDENDSKDEINADQHEIQVGVQNESQDGVLNEIENPGDIQNESETDQNESQDVIQNESELDRNEIQEDGIQNENEDQNEDPNEIQDEGYNAGVLQEPQPIEYEEPFTYQPYEEPLINQQFPPHPNTFIVPQLRTFFVLRYVFQHPLNHLTTEKMMLLVQCPSDWFVICSSCMAAVDNGITLIDYMKLNIDTELKRAYHLHLAETVAGLQRKFISSYLTTFPPEFWEFDEQARMHWHSDPNNVEFLLTEGEAVWEFRRFLHTTAFSRLQGLMHPPPAIIHQYFQPPPNNFGPPPNYFLAPHFQPIIHQRFEVYENLQVEPAPGPLQIFEPAEGYESEISPQNQVESHENPDLYFGNAENSNNDEQQELVEMEEQVEEEEEVQELQQLPPMDSNPTVAHDLNDNFAVFVQQEHIIEQVVPILTITMNLHT